VGAWIVAGWFAWHTQIPNALSTTPVRSKFLVFAFVFVGWIVSLCLHEYGHARAAYWGGDASVAGRGYLTLNPLKYVQPGLSLLLPLVFLLMGGIGLPGGAVYVQPAAIKTKWQRSLMSAAGPIANIIIGVIGGVAYAASKGSMNAHPLFASALAMFVRLQFVAAILNLLPLPGLDGFGVIEPYLGRGFLESIAPYRQYSMFLLLFVAMRSRAFGNLVFDNATRIAGKFAISEEFVFLGRIFFKFWQKIG
jgi:Zn-dependent protease